KSFPVLNWSPKRLRSSSRKKSSNLFLWLSLKRQSSSSRANCRNRRWKRRSSNHQRFSQQISMRPSCSRSPPLCLSRSFTPASLVVQPHQLLTPRYKRCRPAASVIPTVCQAKASKARNWSLPNSAPLICLTALEPAMALVGQKESRAQLQVPGSATALHNQGLVTAAKADKAFRAQGLQRSRWQLTRSTTWTTLRH